MTIKIGVWGGRDPKTVNLGEGGERALWGT